MSEPSRTACAPSDRRLAQVLDLLRGSRFRLDTESAIQADIDLLFRIELGPGGYQREHRFGPGERVDFFVAGRIAVEVKQRRAKAAPTLRQLERYAAYPEVEVLVLVTGWSMDLPAEVNGKPLHIVSLGRSWL
jgi:hypothetical protein